MPISNGHFKNGIYNKIMKNLSISWINSNFENEKFIKMNDIINMFYEDLKKGLVLCLLPIGRVLVEEVLDYGEVKILPPDYLSPDDLRVVSWPKFEFDKIMNNGNATLAWGKSAITQITTEDFFSSSLVAFCVELNWENFFHGSHENHKKLILSYSKYAEETMDRIKILLCRLDLPDTVPGPVGFLEKNNVSAALFYNLRGHEAYIIGCEILTAVVVAGIGLDLCGHEIFPFIGDGETGKRAKSILSFFSRALESSSNTQKAFQIFSIFEAISSKEYKRGSDYRKNISCIISNNHTEYEKNKLILEKWTKSNNCSGSDLRTKIVHRGISFEDALTREEAKLFWHDASMIILQSVTVLKSKAGLSWNEFEEWRADRLQNLVNGRRVDFF